MFTFSFGSAFAVTDFDGKNYQAMQEGDYRADGSVSHGVAGASGITDAERDACGKTAEAAGGNFFLRTNRREGAYAAGRGRVFKQNKNRGEKWTLFCRYSSGL